MSATINFCSVRALHHAAGATTVSAHHHPELRCQPPPCRFRTVNRGDQHEQVRWNVAAHPRHAHLMTHTVDVHDVADDLWSLLAEIEAGGEVVIGRAGRPVARLVPLPTPPRRRVPGAWKGRVWIADDFDDLPEEVAASLEANLVGGADTEVRDDDLHPRRR